MLRVHCELLDKDVIVWASDLIGIDNTLEGIVVRYRCACGHVAEVLDGARATSRSTVHFEAVA
jgi:hypothetical protein